MYTVTLTFTEAAFEAATKARIRRGIDEDKEFDLNGGPTFHGLKQLPQWVGGFLCVELPDGTVYAYNAANVARLKISTTK